MAPKRAARSTPASTAPEPAQTRRGRARPRPSEAPVGSADDEPDTGMARRTRGAAKAMTSSAPAQTRSGLVNDPRPVKGAKKGEVEINSDHVARDDDDDDGEENREYGGENAEDSGDDEGGEGDGENKDDDGDESGGDGDDQADQPTHDVYEVVFSEDDEPIVPVPEEDITFMSANVVRLATVAESVLTSYRSFNGKKDSIARRTYEMELAGLAPVRGFFIVEKLEMYAPFLHWKWLRGRDDELSAAQIDGFKSALITTNLATLLETIYNGAPKDLDSAGKPDAEALQVIDDNFVSLVLAGGRLPLTQPMVELALAVRSARVLTALGAAKLNSEARRVVYDIFCGAVEEPTDDQVLDALRDGPYRRVAGLAGDEVHRRCRSHVAAIARHIGEGGAAFQSAILLRRQQPAGHLLEAIQALFQDVVRPLLAAQTSVAEEEAGGAEEEEFRDAAEQIADEEGQGDDDDDSDDESSDDESQPIVRASESQAGSSHFRGAADLHVLAHSRPSAAVAPPSNQQATASSASRRQGTLPVDQQAAPLSTPSRRRTARPATSHQSPWLLSSPDAAAAAASSHTKQRPSAAATVPAGLSMRGRKRTNSQVDADADDYVPAHNGGDEEEEEEDGEFETDQRRMNEVARAEKRRRIDAKAAERVQRELLQRQAQQQIQHSPRRQHPPLSASSTLVGGGSGFTQRPPPSHPDFETVEINKRAVTTTTRIPASQAPAPFSSSAVVPSSQTVPSRMSAALRFGGRQRHPWSAHDSQVLLESIERHFGKWSLIEAKDNALFEHPRDQQAYRDRARNMKVDYILTDARLPVGFDAVALGAKEKMRCMGLGKNPFRKEEDVDMRTGQVTNTSFVPEGL